MTVAPRETDPPLPIDPNAVLTFSSALQSLELIRAWNRKVLQVSSRIQLLQLHQHPLLNTSWQTLGKLGAGRRNALGHAARGCSRGLHQHRGPALSEVFQSPA